MRKIFVLLTLTVAINACKKTEIAVQHGQEDATVSAAKKGGGSTLTVTTNAATYILSFGATSGGTVSISGGGNNVSERGVCLKASPNPTTSDIKVISGSGSGSFSTDIGGLSSATTYYARAYAIRNSVTTYGNEISFTTDVPDYGTVTDFDGNVYTTIRIGTQRWTVENLKTTRYNNGDYIPNVTDNTAWYNLTTGAYCNYNNDPANVAVYGRLYNGYSVFDSRGLAPAGWHIPTFNDWNILIRYLAGLDGDNIAGGKAKEAGLAHWLAPNTGAVNSSGFTALPGGARYWNYTNGTCSGVTPVFFSDLGREGVWWTSSAVSGGAHFRQLSNNSIQFYRSLFIGCGGYYALGTAYSIRLVQD